MSVTKNDHFLSAKAERRRREARRPLGLAGRRLWPCVDDDDGDGDDDDDDDDE